MSIQTVFQYFGRILQFSGGACYEINVIYKAQIANRPSTEWNGSVMVAEGFLHSVTQIDV